MFAFDQRSLFGADAPAIDPGFATAERRHLSHGAWMEIVPRWLEGDQSLYDVMAEAVEWEQPEVPMYDRMVKTPRLVAKPSPDVHPILGEMVEALSRRHGVGVNNISANWYRDGSDSVAWHGDRVARDIDTSVVAVLSLRGPREFRYRPASGGPSLSLSAGFGDLVVMGGSFQRTWRHAVPKVKSAPPRMAVMFRHSYDDDTVARLRRHSPGTSRP